VSIWKGLRGYHRLFGPRAVLAITIYRLVGKGTPSEIAARVAGVKYLVRIRLESSDAVVYEDVLINRQYAIDLPFSPLTIVDAGANIGMASIYYANRYPMAKIIAIEPEASNFELLVRNVARYPNVVAIQAALWNRDGWISVSQPDAATGASGSWAFVTHEGQGRQVRAITMQTLMTEMNLDSIDVLKVDIEGAEKEVFERCNWLDRVRAIVIELHDRFKPGCSAAVNSATSEFGKSQQGEVTVYVRPA
jgi:FkbM family methyltransferase